MTTTDQPMCTPGSLIANVPGILGYHPQDSVVLFLFARDNAYSDAPSEPTGGRYELGPILRSDAFDPNAIEGMLIQAKHFYPDLVLATIISENLSIDDAEDFAEQLLDVAYFHHLPLCTVWFVPELYSGAPYYQVGGETEEDLGPLTTGRQEWDQGTISNILATDSMENFRRQGILPASSREESFSFLEDPNPFQNHGDRRRLAADAVQKGEAIVSTIASSDAEEAGRIVDGLLEDWQELLDQITSNDHEAGNIMMDDEVLDRASFYFANTRLRDCILHWCFGSYAKAFYQLAVAVARSVSGTAKCNALCCVALCAPTIGRSYRLNQALQVSLEEQPDHSMTSLIAHAQAAGGVHLIAEACQLGAQEAIRFLAAGKHSYHSC